MPGRSRQRPRIFRGHDEKGLEAAREAGAAAYVVKSRVVLDLAEVVVSVARASGEAPESSV